MNPPIFCRSPGKAVLSSSWRAVSSVCVDDELVARLFHAIGVRVGRYGAVLVGGALLGGGSCWTWRVRVGWSCGGRFGRSGGAPWGLGLFAFEPELAERMCLSSTRVHRASPRRLASIALSSGSRLRLIVRICPAIWRLDDRAVCCPHCDVHNGAAEDDRTGLQLIADRSGRGARRRLFLPGWVRLVWLWFGGVNRRWSSAEARTGTARARRSHRRRLERTPALRAPEGDEFIESRSWG